MDDILMRSPRVTCLVVPYRSWDILDIWEISEWRMGVDKLRADRIANVVGRSAEVHN